MSALMHAASGLGAALPSNGPQSKDCLRCPKQRFSFTLHLAVPYMTRWGQNVFVTGDAPCLGRWSRSAAVPCACKHEGKRLVWETSISAPVTPELRYKYLVLDEEGQVEHTDEQERCLRLPKSLQPGELVHVQDHWQDTAHPASLLGRSAFADVILARNRPSGELVHLSGADAGHETVLVHFKVWDWAVQEDEELLVVGCADGQEWPMQEVQAPSWEVQVSLPRSCLPLVYQYKLRGRAGEQSDVAGHRIIAAPKGGSSPSLIVQNDGPFERQHPWRGAATAVPVFSLRSRRSVGCGEFADLALLADFCKAAGLSMIQLLPVNDTRVHGTWWDSYPYSSLSVSALHPMYLSLDAVEGSDEEGIQELTAAARQELDGLHMDYEGTVQRKLDIARRLFQLKGAASMQDCEFQAWFERSQDWLQPYAAFLFLKDLFGSAEHWRWGALAEATPEAIKRLVSPDREFHSAIRFTYWLQWHLHRQLLAASRHAASRGVALKGDLPIGVHKCSVDCWVHPEQFRMQYSTGAPPDYFDRAGQNWGFPTYDWEAMAKDGYTWWRCRLKGLSQYFSAYRIDHVLGFFRIWEIPGDCAVGLLGHFRHSLPLTRQELESKGIWDFDRLCEPYITQELVYSTFGQQMGQEVASRYLEEYQTKRFRLKPAFASEQQIVALEARPGSPDSLVEEFTRLREGLLELRHNVVLLRCSEDPDAFYPRIQLMDAPSFQELPLGWRRDLTALHNDYFYKRQEQLWTHNALQTLPALMRATNMLVCGEDLGMLAPCVHPVMAQLGLVGLRIQRMPSEAGVEFGAPEEYPWMTVASPSCHDTSTSRAWYEQLDVAARERFWTEALQQDSAAPEQCTPDVMQAIVRQHMQCPSMWAIFPLQDLFALNPAYNQRPAAEETINDPAVKHHYWRYRMHVNLEDMVEDWQFTDQIYSMLAESGRGCVVHDAQNHNSKDHSKNR